MTTRISDPDSRIFVSPGLLISKDVSEELITELRSVLRAHPDAYAILEFTSFGPEKRQADCAVVSAGGIDLIEVKRHRGRVTGTAEGEWAAWYGSRKYDMKNRKVRAGSVVYENPFQQARNTAHDLQQGLKDRHVARELRITPMVFLPNAPATSQVTGDSNVGLAVGRAAFHQTLRSATRSFGGRWEGSDPRALAKLLDVRPMNLSFIRGRVLSAFDGQGVNDLEVRADVDGQQIITHTNAGGTYEFAVRLGSRVQIGIVPPGRYLAPEVIFAEAKTMFDQVPEVTLRDRYSRKTEEELRAEITRETQARLEQEVRRVEAAWHDTQLQAGMLIGDLNSQLGQALLRINDQEARIQSLLTADRSQPLPLPVQVRYATELRSIAEQRSDVTGALSQLEQARNEEQQHTLNHVLDVLTRVTLAARHSLSPATSAALPVLLVSTSPRTPDEAPEVLDASFKPDDDYLDITAVEVPAGPPPPARITHERERAVPPPAPAPRPAVSAGEGSAQGPARVSRQRVPWVIPAVAVLLIGGVGALMALRGGQPGLATEQNPVSVAPPAQVPAAPTTVASAAVSGTPAAATPPVPPVVQEPVSAATSVPAPPPVAAPDPEVAPEPVPVMVSPPPRPVIPAPVPRIVGAEASSAPVAPRPRPTPAAVPVTQRPPAPPAPVVQEPAPAAPPQPASPTPAVSTPSPAPAPTRPVTPAAPAPAAPAEQAATPAASAEQVTSDRTQPPGTPVQSTPVLSEEGDLPGEAVPPTPAAAPADTEPLPGEPVN